jgi:hypothetical protein
MPATRKSSARGASGTKQSKRSRPGALDRLNESLDAAQKALGDLQGDLGRGARDMVKNVSRLVRDARRDTAKLNRAVMKDLGQLGQALTPGGNGARTNRRTTTRRAATPAKRTRTRRTTSTPNT